MAEDGGAVGGGNAPTADATTVHAGTDNQDNRKHQLPGVDTNGDAHHQPMSPTVHTPNPFSRAQTSLDIDDYFTGPRDIQKHSKWPLFMQMHGSILPKMIVPLLAQGAWATLITVLTMVVKVPLGINPLLLTVLGFVVGLGLSFRSSTAYERYAEGRRYWAQLILATQTLGRVFWIHGKEREGELKEKDVLAKLYVPPGYPELLCPILTRLTGPP